MMAKRFIAIALLFIALATTSLLSAQNIPPQKKVLLVDSYHADYAWSDGIIDGAKRVAEKEGVAFFVHHMDTKRNKSEFFKQEAGRLAKVKIEDLQPDIVIACDDNASKYLVELYFKNAAMPFIFCGVNLDASIYGYPYKNVTGMVEVSIYGPMLDDLRSISGGKRLGILGTDMATPRKEAEYLRKQFARDFDVKYPGTFEQWKQDYLELQEQNDFVIIWSSAGLSGWDKHAARDFVLKNARVPSGTTQAFMMPYVLLGYTKIPQEQGEWAMATAIEVLRGKSPSKIPITQNKQGKFLINDSMARSLKIDLPLYILESADGISAYDLMQ